MGCCHGCGTDGDDPCSNCVQIDEMTSDVAVACKDALERFGYRLELSPTLDPDGRCHYESDEFGPLVQLRVPSTEILAHETAHALADVLWEDYADQSEDVRESIAERAGELIFRGARPCRAVVRAVFERDDRSAEAEGRLQDSYALQCILMKGSYNMGIVADGSLVIQTPSDRFLVHVARRTTTKETT